MRYHQFYRTRKGSVLERPVGPVRNFFLNVLFRLGYEKRSKVHPMDKE